jgi:hypothetical protein
MSITLHLPPEIEAGLIAEVPARDVPLDNLLEEVVRPFAESTTTGSIIRLPRVSTLMLCFLGTCEILLGQTIKITSPADGILATSGQTLTVTVALAGDTSQLQFVTVNCSCAKAAAPYLTQPPYQFSIEIPPDKKSGVCAIAAVGFPKSGTFLVMDAISVKVERPDLPLKLTVYPSSLYFSHVGEIIRNEIYGTFADGSLVLLTDSTYISYSSDAPGVATVNEQGTVTTVAPGYATLTITYGNTSIGKTSIGVPVQVPYPVMVEPGSISLYASQNQQFTATVSIDARLDQSVAWSINPSLGAIDRGGLYTAPSSMTGERVVTVTATSGADSSKSGSARLRLLPQPRN